MAGDDSSQSCTVMDTLIIKPRSFATSAVLVSRAFAWDMKNSDREMPSAESKSFTLRISIPNWR